jgi:hypothetical protein
MRQTLFALALLLASCAPSTPPARTESFSGTTEATEKQRPDAPVAVLREVRSAGQEGYDRVVFEFEGSAVPGYRIEYQDQPVQCGSGDRVEVAGEAWLQVQLLPAQAHTEAGEPTVQQRERHLDLPVLKELESTCDFEADVTWVLGVAARRPYRVQELAGPARLVVDVGH